MDHARYVQPTARGLGLVWASVHVSRTTIELLMKDPLTSVHVSECCISILGVKEMLL